MSCECVWSRDRFCCYCRLNGEQMPFIRSHEKNLCFPRCQFPFLWYIQSRKKAFFFSVVVFVIRLLYVSINNRLQWKKDSTWLQNVQMNKVQSIIWIYILMYLLRSYVGFCRKICTIYFLSWSTTMYARARARVSREWKWDCRMFNNKDKTYIHTVSSKLQ